MTESNDALISVPDSIRPHLSKGQELIQRPDGILSRRHPVAGGSLFFALPAFFIADILAHALQRFDGFLEYRDTLRAAHAVDCADALAFLLRGGENAGLIVPVSVIVGDIDPHLSCAAHRVHPTPHLVRLVGLQGFP